MRTRTMQTELKILATEFPVEIKSSAKFSLSFTAGMRHFQSVFPDMADSGFVFFNCTPLPEDVCDGVRIVNPAKECPFYRQCGVYKGNNLTNK